jgi:hypothetical protein
VAVGIDAPGFIELLLERLGSLDRDAERRD